MISARTSHALRARLADAHSRREQGAAFLEAFLSIMLLIALSFGTWAVAEVIFNQAILNGSSQMAANQALLVYDRESYRSTYNPDAYTDALNVVTQIVNVDGQNMAGSSVNSGSSSDSFLTAGGDFSLYCASSFDGFSTPQLCQNSSGPVEQAVVKLVSSSTYVLIEDLVNASAAKQFGLQHATGYAYSSGPADR